MVKEKTKNKNKKEKIAVKKLSLVKARKVTAKSAKPKVNLKPIAVKIKKSAVIPKEKTPLKKEKIVIRDQIKQQAADIEVKEKIIAKPQIHLEKPVLKEEKKEFKPLKEAAGQIHKPVIKESPVILQKEQVPKIAPVKTGKEHAFLHKTIARPEAVIAKSQQKIEEPGPVVKEARELELELPISVKDLAVKLQEKPSVIIKNLMDIGVMVGINQSLSEDAVNKICQKYNCTIKKAATQEETILKDHEEKDIPRELKPRSPIVTFMGHVDHGKTSLLDAIRKTKVVDSEHGGITQHIGAYRVKLDKGEITFLDTPGHEAFTAMRSRGASITDIVVLVVAADDGIMPQTEEAIDHARAAEVPIIVAMNKIDKPQADLDKLKKQLSKHDLTPEDWSGKTIAVGVSAKTGAGIDNLLEMILLEAEMLELKANPNRIARGVVIEAKMAKGRGPVVTLLVQNGTLKLNDNIIVGSLYGKTRAMFNDRGAAVIEAGPSVPVEVLGISGIPEAGEQFFVVEEEKAAKELAQMRLEKDKEQQIKEVKRISLEDLHSQIQQGKIKELKIIIKADVQGSLEAIKDTLAKLNVSEIKIDIIHTGVGNINSSDVILAVASNALILGFNIAADERAKELIAKEGVDVKTYNIIYELANDIKAAVEGMLEPKLKKVFLGRAEVRKIFKLSKAGMVAGCFVTKGKINRNSMVTVMRNGQDVFEGKLSSLKRFKDDVRDVQEGFECGMAVGGFDQLQEGDIIEAYEIEKILRKL